LWKISTVVGFELNFHQLMHQVLRNAVVLGVEDDVAVNVQPERETTG
jgi:hypothetical protein